MRKGVINLHRVVKLQNPCDHTEHDTFQELTLPVADIPKTQLALIRTFLLLLIESRRHKRKPEWYAGAKLGYGPF